MASWGSGVAGVSHHLLPQSGAGIYLLAHLVRFGVWIVTFLLPTVPGLRSMSLMLFRA